MSGTPARGGKSGGPGGGDRSAGRRTGKRSGPNPAVRRALRRGAAYHTPRIVLERFNYIIMVAGLAAVIVGFILLANQEITLSPILLVLGYCILLPAAFLLRRIPGRRTPPDSGEPSGGE